MLVASEVVSNISLEGHIYQGVITKQVVNIIVASASIHTPRNCSLASMDMQLRKWWKMYCQCFSIQPKTDVVGCSVETADNTQVLVIDTYNPEYYNEVDDSETASSGNAVGDCVRISSTRTRMFTVFLSNRAML